MKKAFKMLLIFAALLCAYGCAGSGYSSVIKANWGLSLPSGYEEVCSYSNSGFHGDGERYHVFSYSEAASNSEEPLFFLSDMGRYTTPALTAKAEAILDALGVESGERPNFDDCAFEIHSQEDGSEMIMAWDSGRSVLYVFESFL